MGTNYYLTKVCQHCKQAESPRHIGKSSGGWNFALHVYPDQAINNLTDWQKLMLAPGAKIVNEYGQDVDFGSMMGIIMARGRHPQSPLKSATGLNVVGHEWFSCDLITGDFC